MRRTLLVLLVTFGSSTAFAQDSSSVTAGEQIYASNCAVCHGEELRNTGATFDLRNLRADERKRFDAAVMNGKGQMPPWSGVLNESDLSALWAYIQANAD